jgi:hypothetical protein
MNMESLPPALPQSNVLVTMGMRARVRGLTSGDIGKTLNGLIVTVMEEAVYTSHNKTRTQVHRTGTGNDIDKEDLPRLPAPATTVNI